MNVKEEKAEVECKCGYIGEAKILERGHDTCLFVCRKCGEVPKILKGDKIKLISVDVE